MGRATATGPRGCDSGAAHVVARLRGSNAHWVPHVVARLRGRNGQAARHCVYGFGGRLRDGGAARHCVYGFGGRESGRSIRNRMND